MTIWCFLLPPYSIKANCQCVKLSINGTLSYRNRQTTQKIGITLTVGGTSHDQSG
jgi:hypothetical protein